jgi:hypothetical protein
LSTSRSDADFAHLLRARIQRPPNHVNSITLSRLNNSARGFEYFTSRRCLKRVGSKSNIFPPRAGKKFNFVFLFDLLLISAVSRGLIPHFAYIPRGILLARLLINQSLRASQSAHQIAIYIVASSECRRLNDELNFASKDGKKVFQTTIRLVITRTKQSFIMLLRGGEGHFLRATKEKRKK